MKQNIIIIFIVFLMPLVVKAQSPDTINRTDVKGNKQGYWIKRYPGGNIQYEGYFLDNQPAGTFKRYYENDTIQSILFYSKNREEADAIFFHRNGFIASTGKYISRKKEGKWSFYSSVIEGYLVLEENYRNNLRQGLSVNITRIKQWQKKYGIKTIPGMEIGYSITLEERFCSRPIT